MFRIHRLFIKTAIAYLVLGVGLGGWLLVRKAVSGEGGSHDLALVHTHLVLVGFMLMMVMGVSLWMFPRRPGMGKEVLAKDPLAWGTYLLLNAGLLLRMVSEPLLPLPPARVTLGLAALLQVAGVLLFVRGIWGRVRPPSMVPDL
jgi:nitric oxide reductase large subunit